MIFADVSIDDAEGVVLAHTQRLGGYVLKKGLRLAAADISLLREAGVQSVIGARLEAGDLDENCAAAIIAKAVTGDNLTLSKAKTGRCNLLARCHGIVSVNAEAINGANAIDEAITIATLPAFASVTPGDTVATIKIIPLAVAESKVLSVEGILKDERALSVLPLNPARIGLVLTRVAGGRETLLDKAASALRSRLDNLGLTLAAEMRCAHQASEVSATIATMEERGIDLHIICGAAATVDRGDVVPAGIEQAGGRIKQFGMPVEPGNLLVLAELNGKPVIGMPGCARSPRLNGFDWVLQRLLAGVPFEAADLMAMGVGGLIVETARGRMRSEKQMEGEAAGPAVTSLPRIAAIVLAAGSSRRMGATNKLLTPYRGAPLVTHAIRAALASKANPIIVVTGHEKTEIMATLSGLNLQFVHAANYAEGMSQSIRAGLSALPPDIGGAMIMLGDMPLIQPETIDRLIGAFDPWADASICIPSYNGKRGNPILLAREFFNDIMALKGDTGARSLLVEHNDQIVEVPVEDEGVLRDFDTVKDLEQDSSMP